MSITTEASTCTKHEDCDEHWLGMLHAADRVVAEWFSGLKMRGWPMLTDAEETVQRRIVAMEPAILACAEACGIDDLGWLAEDLDGTQLQVEYLDARISGQELASML